MFFKKNNVDMILSKAKHKRVRELSNDLDNIVFLDFDGVINLDFNNYAGIFKVGEPINNLNKFCLENNFKIVVISSWRKYPNYKDILYNSGLDKRVEILGKTDVLESGRELEILKYLEDNCYIDKFIIFDDGIFNELSKYHIRTKSNIGFDNEKYVEALNLINNWK